jgi:arylsulfatase
MLIITSDHGEVFGEHGYYEHPRYPYRELLHVPLFISLPYNCQTIYEDPVSTLDIVPTILNECNIHDGNIDGVALQSRWTSPNNCSDEYRFGQASTENKDGNWVRRYGIHTNNSGEIIEYTLSEDREKTLIWSNNATEKLSNHLHEHALGRLENNSNVQTKQSGAEENESTSDEIEGRLEALGYLDR